jgi:transposase InsO family protein
VERAFGPGTIELDRAYVGDVTHIWTWEGWMYFASVIDLASRRVVGWSMADHMEASLVCDTLGMAIHSRRLGPGFLLHSYRGSQILTDNGGIQSLSRKCQCWDNAVGESWFATLKTELICRQSWATKAQVGRFHRSVHGPGHDDRRCDQHRPMETPGCQARRCRCPNARRLASR